MPETVLRFAGFRLDLAAARLFRGDEAIPLRPKTFATLCALVARPGALVTKDDLLAAVWPGVAVTEDMPRFSVRELRRALGDDPASPRVIETVHGRGYRFITPVSPGAGRHERAAAPSPPATRPTIVVGRDAELATLAAWLAAAERGERTVGFLAGDAGIGKTTLVDALLAKADRHPDLVIARAECREVIGVDEPYRPLLEALQGLAAGPARDAAVDGLRVHAPTWLAQLPSLLAADEEAALRQRLFGATGERMVREFAGWIDAMSATTPLLLVLEDLHWSDRATLDALAAVAHGRTPAHVLVLATYRPVDAIVTNHPLRGLVQEIRRKRLGADLTLSVLTRDAVPRLHHGPLRERRRRRRAGRVHPRSVRRQSVLHDRRRRPARGCRRRQTGLSANRNARRPRHPRHAPRDDRAPARRARAGNAHRRRSGYGDR